LDHQEKKALPKRRKRKVVRKGGKVIRRKTWREEAARLLKKQKAGKGRHAFIHTDEKGEKEVIPVAMRAENPVCA